MSRDELLRRAKQRLEGLSRKHLIAADQFLAWFEEHESIEATEELLAIPGFLQQYEQGCKEAAEGNLTPFEEIDWEDQGGNS